ncbi:radical SAM protein [Methyloprofundus sedimenti]|uniref:Radical SAM protein n=1 Tax=Methyloprofundus sedimenti TaxID=1420851 RepID=A0A1V8M2T0_9GAMM|nr:radical SAM protein [Methyloprofundus sedimenti]OQK15859.1 radical SAM protein [Methyloprofundus sedimenti]
MSRLTVKNHDRDVAGYRYIYPVISRRSGGLSIGINFNTNNACNWRCVYCQVPDLSIGAAPQLDFELLATELADFLQDVLHGNFYQRFEIEPVRQMIKDVAISGNGEPTSVHNFAKAIALITQIVERANIPDPFQYVLITNGSLIHKADVQAGLRLFNQYNGQLWYKLDSATDFGREQVNHAGLSSHKQLENLISSAKLCATWIQTCVLGFASAKGNVGLLEEQEQDAYLVLLTQAIQQVPLQGVMLYSLARLSLQPEADRITTANLEQLNDFAERIRKLGLSVKVSL